MPPYLPYSSRRLRANTWVFVLLLQNTLWKKIMLELQFTSQSVSHLTQLILALAITWYLFSMKQKSIQTWWLAGVMGGFSLLAFLGVAGFALPLFDPVRIFLEHMQYATAAFISIMLNFSFR